MENIKLSSIMIQLMDQIIKKYEIKAIEYNTLHNQTIVYNNIKFATRCVLNIYISDEDSKKILPNLNDYELVNNKVRLSLCSIPPVLTRICKSTMFCLCKSIGIYNYILKIIYTDSYKKYDIIFNGFLDINDNNHECNNIKKILKEYSEMTKQSAEKRRQAMKKYHYIRRLNKLKI